MGLPLPADEPHGDEDDVVPPVPAADDDNDEGCVFVVLVMVVVAVVAEDLLRSLDSTGDAEWLPAILALTKLATWCDGCCSW